MQCMMCHRELPVADAAFCPYCGAAVQSPKRAVPDGVKQLLSSLEKQKDPAKKHAMLLEAQKEYPDSLEIAEEILFLGRLYERSPKKLDYSVIKSYLLHMYLTPENFSPERRTEMREELFGHPHLKRCLALAEDQNAFLRRYLGRLSTEFITIFLLSSTYYTKSFFGFRLDTRMGRVLAEPACTMLCAIRSDEQLAPEQRVLLYDAFYRAFVTETGGEARWVDELLEKKGYPVPAR